MSTTSYGKGVTPWWNSTFTSLVVLCVMVSQHTAMAQSRSPYRSYEVATVTPSYSFDDGIPPQILFQQSRPAMWPQPRFRPGLLFVADRGSAGEYTNPFEGVDENLPFGGDTYVLPPYPLEQPQPSMEEPRFGLSIVPQRSSVTGTWLGSGGEDGLGIVELDLSTTFASPVPWLERTHFSITPNMGLRSLDAPDGISLPSELIQGSVMFSLTRPISEKTKITIGIAPGFYSDTNGGNSDALRLLAVANLSWQSSPTTQWQVGVVATGRDDTPILPLAGVVWTPSPDWQLELTVPRPRISYRLIDGGGCRDHWLYLGGEFGGGTWAVDREGQDDLLNMRDFRLLVGWETKGIGGVNGRVEAGYVFGREVEYESDGLKYEPSDTVMLRAGFSF